MILDETYYSIPTVIRKRAYKKPKALLLDPEWRYVPANETDVRQTWVKFGWTPPHNNHPVVCSK